jgi:hypothetical protein
MSPSQFRSNTSCLAAALLAVLAGGCSGDSQCGPMGAPSTGLVAASSTAALTYGNLTSLAGNDCPDPAAPAGVVSLSIEGTQTDGTGLITLCIPRPDLLDSAPRSLGTSMSMADVRIFDLSGTADNCTLTLDATRPPTGTAIGLGVCGNGTDPAGFALDVDGAVSLKRTCGATVDTVAVTLSGRVAVTKR